jgi:acyl carrier protein
MTEVDVARRARIVIARELACPLRRLTDGAEFRRDLGADSLDLVNIPHALEDEFGVRFNDDEVEFTQTVGTAIDLSEPSWKTRGVRVKRWLRLRRRLERSPDRAFDCGLLVTAANRSSAVMQQKRPDTRERASGRDVAPRALNYFPTPPWATRALVRVPGSRARQPEGADLLGTRLRRRHMVRALEEYFGDVIATDVHDIRSPALNMRSSTSRWRRWSSSPKTATSPTSSSPTRRSRWLMSSSKRRRSPPASASRCWCAAPSWKAAIGTRLYGPGSRPTSCCSSRTGRHAGKSPGQGRRRRPVREEGRHRSVDRNQLCLAGLAEGQRRRHQAALDWPVPPRLERAKIIPIILTNCRPRP